MKEKGRTILFIILILFLSIGNILTPIKTFSSKENRYLQGLPEIKYDSILSGRFNKEFETFATDQFIGRDSWISLKTIWDLSMLKKDNGRVYFGKENFLIDMDKEIDEEQFTKNITNLNIFLNKVESLGDIKITALLVPSKSKALAHKLPSYGPTIDEGKLVDRIKSSLNINILDLIDILSKKSNEYIYYKTDHHWTTKGAFYAYEYYLDKIGDKPLKKDDFIISKVSDDFLGTSYRKANLYLGNPDKIYIYIPKDKVNYNLTINNQTKTYDLYDRSFLDKTDKYSFFLGGNKALIEIDTSINNEKTILIIKDSFANSFIPFLINHYDRLIVIDPRYFKGDVFGFLKDQQVNEVLFLFNIQNFVQEKSFNIFSR